jgi:hypothetical protein
VEGEPSLPLGVFALSRTSNSFDFLEPGSFEMRATILWSVLAGTGGLLVYFAGARFGAAPSSAAAVAPAKSITTETPSKRAGSASGTQLRVARLEAELAALREHVAEKEGASSAPSATAELEAEPPPTEEDLKRGQEQWHATMAEVEANYQAERRDPRWSQEAAAKLNEALAGFPALSKSVRSIECRSDTCRVEVIDDQKGDFAKQLPLLPQKLAGSLPRLQADFEAQPDGTVKRTLYFSRHAEAPET